MSVIAGRARSVCRRPGSGTHRGHRWDTLVHGCGPGSAPTLHATALWNMGTQPPKITTGGVDSTDGNRAVGPSTDRARRKPPRDRFAGQHRHPAAQPSFRAGLLHLQPQVPEARGPVFVLPESVGSPHLAVSDGSRWTLHHTGSRSTSQYSRIPAGIERALVPPSYPRCIAPPPGGPLSGWDALRRTGPAEGGTATSGCGSERGSIVPGSGCTRTRPRVRGRKNWLGRSRTLRVRLAR